MVATRPSVCQGVRLTCADVLGSDEDWLEIAESIELGPRTVIAPEAVTAALAGTVTE